MPRVLLLAVALLLTAAPVRAQVEADTSASNPYGTGLGGAVLLTNSGFGLGGYGRLAVSRSTSLLAEMSLGTGKDEREVTFFDRFGRRDIPNKANYLLLLPVQVGVQHRLFQANIEDNFRPFVQVSAGPTLGWQYPYFQDCNGNDSYDRNVDCDGDGELENERTFDALGSLGRGDLHLGLGGTLAIGANFGFSRRISQGVRIGYVFTYFLEPIQLLEPSVQDARHFFGSPSISILFGRLY